MRSGVAVSALVVAFVLIYLPDLGHGFIKDDFGWVLRGAVANVTDLTALLTGDVGFYRPAVSLSFAIDRAIWDTNPFGFGVTNLVLCLADATLLFALARRFYTPPAAGFASAVWLFNFHGINMAILWLSGRTALLVVLFGLATVLAVLDRRWIIAGLLCLAALFSKEEAVVFPALLTVYLASAASADSARVEWRRLTAHTLPLWAALVVYAVLRINSGAFGPLDAPSYYRLSLSPALLARNVAEYTDRAGTFAAVVTLALVLAARARPWPFEAGERRALLLAALWIPATYAITVLVPVRSSLYAVLPSVGSALAAGAVASAVARRHPAVFTKTATALLVAVFLLIPIYRSRNVSWVRVADLSTGVLTTLKEAGRGRPAGSVVLVDNPGLRFNLDAAFGSALTEGLRLTLGPGWTGEILPSPSAHVPDATLVFRLADPGLEPLPAAPGP